MHDDELKRRMVELRERDRRSGVPTLDAVMSHSRRPVPLSHGTTVPLAAAIAALLVLGVLARGRVLAPEEQQIAVATWTSPTASLLAVPGLQLTTASLTSSVVNLETTADTTAQANSKGDSI